MRLSRYLLPVLKETPAEAQIASHRLMLRAGMVRQLAAGLYNWLPLGHRVLTQIGRVVREEMDRAGALELLMPCIQPAELWRESGRYDAYGKEMLRITDRHERDLLFGPTNEEVITDLFRQNVKSYKDLPLNLYHIQWKFRDEIRPRFGVMRGREFLMKDAYSFDLDFAGAQKTYDTMYRTYLRAFARMGLKAVPVKADTGAIGGSMSHEFQILAETGESEVFYDAAFDEMPLDADHIDIAAMKALYTAADEMHDPKSCPVPADRLKSARGIEVGHIFYLGTKYSEMLGAKVAGQDGAPVTAEMGCYGIGVSRLVGAVIEANHDEHGIIWPEEIAPFKFGLINMRPGDAACDRVSEELYTKLMAAGVDTLYDDTTQAPGAKFATMDLIGLPWVVTVGPRGVLAGTVEIKCRRTGEKQEVSLESGLATMQQFSASPSGVVH